jgi:glutamine amidotransferase
LKGALEKIGYRVIVGQKEVDFVTVDAIFLPGVGSFPYAMDNLRSSGMDKFIERRFVAEDLPFIGICLGMQILFETSEEGDREGLGLLEGKVTRFRDKECHVGWNLVDFRQAGSPNIRSAFYFNHSYRVDCAPGIVVATADYQGEFAVIATCKKFTGVQFHPEKSQKVGASLLHSLIGD